MSSLTPADPHDPLAARVGTLPNGLTVLLSPDHEEPRVFCRVVVRAGAAQEPRNQTGLAHYLEHMLANKGSQRLGTLDYPAEERGLSQIEEAVERLRQQEDPRLRAPEIAALFAAEQTVAGFAVRNELKQIHGRLGSRELNAFTSHDQTSFVVDVPAERLGAWARLDADRFLAPVFRGFVTEVQTVCEEKRRSLDDPDKELFWGFMGALWGGHPYGETILGRSEHLERPSIAAMREFYRAHYTGPNMAVILAGDLDPDAAFALVAEEFGRLPASPPPALPAPPPALRGAQRRTVTHQGAPELWLGWRAGGAEESDRAALRLLDRVLHNDGTGLLDRLTQREAVRACGSWQSRLRRGGHLCVWGRPRAGQDLDELEALLREELATLRRGDLPVDLLQGIVRNLLVEEAATLESRRSRAALLADAFLHDRDPRTTGRWLQELRGLTLDDVVRVARETLTEDEVVVRREQGAPGSRGPVALVPPPLPPGASGPSPFGLSVMELPSTPPERRPLVLGEQVTEAWSDGISVLHAVNPYSDLTRITLRWEHGSVADPLLPTALALLARAGEGSDDRATLQGWLYARAASTEASAGRVTTELGLAAPAETAPEALDRLLRRLIAPTIERDEAHRVIDDLLLRRVQARSTRDHAVQALRAWAMHGADSAFVRRPDADALRGLADVGPASSVGRLAATAPVALVTGPGGAAEWAARLTQDRAPCVTAAPLRLVQPAVDRVLFLHHEAAQAQVQILAPAGPYRVSDYGSRRLWAEVMGGAAGLVFQELREQRGMAYSARAGLNSGWRVGDDNHLWLEAGTDPAKAAEVAALLLHLLRELPASAARLERARAGALARRSTDRVGFRGAPAQVLNWRAKGIERDPQESHMEELAATSDDAVRAYARSLAARPMTLAIVGPADRVDRAALERIAPVQELTLDTITRH